jgi:CheY-like chemotaxis protein/MinD-like ATPase involved in chromosome partitioning or flagellar assembly
MAERILIIDDDVDTLKLVGLMLERQGYEISAAVNGQQGLDKAFAEPPDVILLDIMMPDMDGFEVARRLRKNPPTKSTPILMFTARTELDDKVTGFEAGADDYLTKPTSPAELQAHVRALLSRAPEAEAKVTSAQAIEQHGDMIGVLAARGGLGVSTLASNLAAALFTRTARNVILAELTPGQGTLAMDLGASSPRALNELLAGKPEEITGEAVGSRLAPHDSGLHLLLASENPRDVGLSSNTAQYEALFRRLAGLAEFAVLDLGSGLPAFAAKLLPQCDERIVVTEANSNTLAHTRILLEEIAALGVAPADITIVLNNRMRFETQIPWAEAQEKLGHAIDATLTPAPEMFVAAARRHTAGVLAMPENVTSQQILKLADQLVTRRKAE